MKTQERTKRYNKKLMVSISENKDLGMDLIGVTSNISKTGICIVTDKKLDLNEEIAVLIAAEGDIFSLTGESIWHSTYSDSFICTGISLVSSSPDYIHFINKINYH